MSIHVTLIDNSNGYTYVKAFSSESKAINYASQTYVDDCVEYGEMMSYTNGFGFDEEALLRESSMDELKRDSYITADIDGLTTYRVISFDTEEAKDGKICVVTKVTDGDTQVNIMADVDDAFNNTIDKLYEEVLQKNVSLIVEDRENYDEWLDATREHLDNERVLKQNWWHDLKLGNPISDEYSDDEWYEVHEVTIQ